MKSKINFIRKNKGINDGRNDDGAVLLACVIYIFISPIIAGVASFIITLVQSGYSTPMGMSWFLGPDYLQWVAPVSMILCAVLVWPFRRRPLARLVGMLIAVTIAVTTNAWYYPGAVVK